MDLNDYIEKTGIKTKVLVERTGVTRATLSRIRRGQRACYEVDEKIQRYTGPLDIKIYPKMRPAGPGRPKKNRLKDI